MCAAGDFIAGCGPKGGVGDAACTTPNIGKRVCSCPTGYYIKNSLLHSLEYDLGATFPGCIGMVLLLTSLICQLSATRLPLWPRPRPTRL